MKTALWWGAGLVALELGLVLFALLGAGSTFAPVAFGAAVANVIAHLLGSILIVTVFLIPIVGVIAFFVRRMPARMVDRDPGGEGLR